jgi:hypothetical protein
MVDVGDDGDIAEIVSAFEHNTVRVGALGPPP